MENTEQTDTINDSILRIENSLHERSLRQKNQIAVALAYLEADQPNLAKLVLEGMEP